QLGLPQFANGVRELDQLQRGGKVAREEDHAAHLRVLQAFDVVAGEFQAANVDHRRTELHAYPSRTTNATATPASSVNEMWDAFTPRTARCFAIFSLGWSNGRPRTSRATVML